MIDPTTPGFDEMMFVGAEMSKVLPVLSTTQTKFNVDLYEGSLTDFVVTTHWGRFVLHQIEQDQRKLWAFALLRTCGNCTEEHELDAPFASETAAYIIAVAVTSMIMQKVCELYDIPDAKELH
jgi:hypothetical protein